MALGYPLDWPVGWKRYASHQRTSSDYRVDFQTARDDLMRSLKLMNAKNVVSSSGIPLRIDGLPYASHRDPEDPGVAVYFDIRLGREWKSQVIACDRWSRVRENLRAVGYAVESMRTIRRCGASEILERAYSGFSALPSEAGQRALRAWWDVLGVSVGCGKDDVKAAYRARAASLHPDKGGTNEQMQELNRAYNEALKERQ